MMNASIWLKENYLCGSSTSSAETLTRTYKHMISHKLAVAFDINHKSSLAL